MERSTEEYIPGNSQALWGRDRIMQAKKLLIKKINFLKSIPFMYVKL